MPKQKFVLSKKHEKLIDIEVSVPSISEFNHIGVNKEWIVVDHRGNAENSLVVALETISRNTVYEEVCKNIVSKCEAIFQHYDDRR